MKEEKIIILNDKGQKLVGHHYKNTSDTLLILCHGTETFSSYLEAIEPFLKAYFNMGLSVFLFDFTGYGESEGKGKFNHSQRVADIGSVLNFFKSKYKKIILCGMSLGAISATIAATKYKEITKLYLINGYYDLKLTYPKFYLSTLLGYVLSSEIRNETIYAWRNLNPEKICIPTLVVVGENDTIVNPKQSIDFYNRLKTKKKLIMIPGGDHALMNKEYLIQYVPQIKIWINENN